MAQESDEEGRLIQFPAPRRWYYCGPDLREHYAGSFRRSRDALAAILRKHKGYAGLAIEPYTKDSEKG